MPGEERRSVVRYASSIRSSRSPFASTKVTSLVTPPAELRPLWCIGVPRNQAAARPFVNGDIAWLLKDFRVHPTWAGGNPLPNPPWNNKGLIDENGSLKPAFFSMQSLWRRTPPLR